VPICVSYRVLRVFAVAAVWLMSAWGERSGAAEPANHAMPTGSWRIVSQTIGGEAVPDERITKQWIEIDETSLFRCGASGFRLGGKLTTNAARMPRQFDFEYSIGGETSMNQGIFKIEGRRLTICYDNTGKSRPTEFASPKGSKQLVLSVLEPRQD
jgi:uncharacterized protein (TIGR03067 family)